MAFRNRMCLPWPGEGQDATREDPEVQIASNSKDDEFTTKILDEKNILSASLNFFLNTYNQFSGTLFILVSNT